MATYKLQCYKDEKTVESTGNGLKEMLSDFLLAKESNDQVSLLKKTKNGFVVIKHSMREYETDKINGKYAE